MASDRNCKTCVGSHGKLRDARIHISKRSADKSPDEPVCISFHAVGDVENYTAIVLDYSEAMEFCIDLMSVLDIPPSPKAGFLRPRKGD